MRFAIRNEIFKGWKLGDTPACAGHIRWVLDRRSPEVLQLAVQPSPYLALCKGYAGADQLRKFSRLIICPSLPAEMAERIYCGRGG